MKKRSILKTMLYFLNLCAVSCLLASYMSEFISPDKFWVLAFFGLAYPVFLIINIIFVIFWLITWNRFIFVSLIAILAGFNSLQAIYPVRFSKQESTSYSKVRIVSYNVHSLYGNEKPDSKQETKSKVTEFLARQNADIICVQEFFATGEDYSQTLSKFAKSIHLGYYSFKNYRELGNKRKINAIATFSRFPIVNSGCFRLPGRSHYAIFSDVIMGRDTVRVYNLHLESIRFGSADYSFYSNLTEPDVEEPSLIKEGSKRMLWKLRRAFILRSKQVLVLKEHLASCTYPVILSGDFNDTPTSFTYHQLTGKLTDSFIESGHGLFMSTYAGKFPSFRIDYILHSDKFRSISYHTSEVDLSDHFPITTTLVKIP
ncbi:MAG: endonuclease/exonuclease/phosphatase family protein [Bacteroidetes bacterium]|nr:endonuclease/exonuclease/phosphatase family protein [Bacteroidota bacterium]